MHGTLILPRILALPFMATLSHDPRGYFPTDERKRVRPSIEQCIVGHILAIAHRYAAFTVYRVVISIVAFTYGAGKLWCA